MRLQLKVAGTTWLHDSRFIPKEMPRSECRKSRKLRAGSATGLKPGQVTTNLKPSKDVIRLPSVSQPAISGLADQKLIEIVF